MAENIEKSRKMNVVISADRVGFESLEFGRRNGSAGMYSSGGKFTSYELNECSPAEQFLVARVNSVSGRVEFIPSQFLEMTARRMSVDEIKKRSGKEMEGSDDEVREEISTLSAKRTKMVKQYRKMGKNRITGDEGKELGEKMERIRSEIKLDIEKKTSKFSYVPPFDRDETNCLNFFKFSKIIPQNLKSDILVEKLQNVLSRKNGYNHITFLKDSQNEFIKSAINHHLSKEPTDDTIKLNTQKLAILIVYTIYTIQLFTNKSPDVYKNSPIPLTTLNFLISYYGTISLKRFVLTTKNRKRMSSHILLLSARLFDYKMTLNAARLLAADLNYKSPKSFKNIASVTGLNVSIPAVSSKNDKESAVCVTFRLPFKALRNSAMKMSKKERKTDYMKRVIK